MQTAACIIAHRGASADAPENTLRAVQLAWELGAGAAEVDIRTTRDGRLVAIHDSTTGRTADRDLRVASSTLDELRDLRFGPARSEPIATLEDLLAGLPPGRELVIELKSGTETFGPLGETLSAFPSTRHSLIAFDLALAAAARQRFPDTRVLWITEKGCTPARVRAAAEAGLQGVDFKAGGEQADAAWIGALHTAALLAWTWTVDDPVRAARLFAGGVDALTTNIPGLMQEAGGRSAGVN